MVNIQNINSDVIVEDDSNADYADKSHEVQIEELRNLVREILQEEIERYIRVKVENPW